MTLITESTDSRDRDIQAPDPVPLPPVPRVYRAKLLLEREITVTAVSDEDFEDQAMRLLGAELDPAKYQLLQIATQWTAAQWS